MTNENPTQKSNKRRNFSNLTFFMSNKIEKNKIPKMNGENEKIMFIIDGVVVTFWLFHWLRIGSRWIVKYWYNPIINVGKQKEITLINMNLPLLRFNKNHMPNNKDIITAANGEMLTSKILRPKSNKFIK